MCADLRIYLHSRASGTSLITLITLITLIREPPGSSGSGPALRMNTRMRWDVRNIQVHGFEHKKQTNKRGSKWLSKIWVVLVWLYYGSKYDAIIYRRVTRAGACVAHFVEPTWVICFPCDELPACGNTNHSVYRYKYINVTVAPLQRGFLR